MTGQDCPACHTAMNRVAEDGGESWVCPNCGGATSYGGSKLPDRGLTSASEKHDDLGSILFGENYEVEKPDTDGVDPDVVNRACCRFCEAEFDDRAEQRGHHCTAMTTWRSRQDWEAEIGSTIRPAVHELGAKLLFASDKWGMQPFFGVHSQFMERCLRDQYENENGAIVTQDDEIGTFEAAGDTWRLNHDEKKVKYWHGKIEARDEDDVESYTEYNIGIVADDEVGRKRVNFQFRPALPDATHVDTGKRIQSLPKDLPEGIRVKIDSANVPKEELLPILRALADAMGLHSDYFATEHLHEWSRLYNYALYVRLLRQTAKDRLVGEQGFLERLATFASRRKGRGEWLWDNEKAIGRRSAVAMDETNLDKLFPGHSFGKLLKCYLKKNPGPDDPDDPTTQPKVEVQYSTDYSEHTAIPWDSQDEFDASDLHRELDEFLMNGLEWAGISLNPEADHWIPDAYWDAVGQDRNVSVFPNPLEDVEHHEESLAVHHFTGAESTPSQRKVVEAVTNGGPMHRTELVEETGTSESTVYRALNKFGDVLESINGKIQFQDSVIREKFKDLFGMLEDTIDYVKRGTKAIHEGKTVIAEDSPIAQWARRYGATINRAGEGVEINFQAGVFSLDQLRRVLRSGFMAAGPVLEEELLDNSTTVTYQDEEDGRTEVGNPFQLGQSSYLILGRRLQLLG